jgi:hypothetical protein
VRWPNSDIARQRPCCRSSHPASLHKRRRISQTIQDESWQPRLDLSLTTYLQHSNNSTLSDRSHITRDIYCTDHQPSTGIMPSATMRACPCCARARCDCRHKCSAPGCDFCTIHCADHCQCSNSGTCSRCKLQAEREHEKELECGHCCYSGCCLTCQKRIENEYKKELGERMRLAARVGGYRWSGFYEPPRIPRGSVHFDFRIPPRTVPPPPTFERMEVAEPPCGPSHGARPRKLQGEKKDRGCLAALWKVCFARRGMA